MTAHQPIRTCIGCGRKKRQRELLRVVRTPEENIEIDLKKQRPGRGAYLCFESACLQKAIKRKSFERHLKVTVPSQFYAELADLLNG